MCLIFREAWQIHVSFHFRRRLVHLLRGLVSPSPVQAGAEVKGDQASRALCVRSSDARPLLSI